MNELVGSIDGLNVDVELCSDSVALFRAYMRLLQQMSNTEHLVQPPLHVGYCDFDELCSHSVVLRIFQRSSNLSLAKGVAFAIRHSCCVTGASKCNR